MRLKSVGISVLAFLLLSCAQTPVEGKPEKPGVSLPLSFPVLLIGDSHLFVKDDETSLITTTAASGLAFPDFKIVDSAGVECEILKATEFGKRSVFSDMGTSPFHVFLTVRRLGNISLEGAKMLVLAEALKPNGPGRDTPQSPKIATDRIQSCRSLSQLIAACRKTWEWR